MKIVEEFLKSKEPNTYVFPIEWLKEFALEIASNAYDEGFTYGIRDVKITGMNKAEYSQKLHREL